MKVCWHGHSCLSIVLEDQTKILIDPFITGNPMTDLVVDQVRCDYIFITHAHDDHLGDSVEIAKNNHATIITTVELAKFLSVKHGCHCHGMQPGGFFKTPYFNVKMVPAIHGSGYTLEDGTTIELGLAVGFIISGDDRCIYHAGDTALFSDMRLIGEQRRLDYAFLPIGDNYTMGPKDACKAASFLQARHVVPIHYNTFELIQQNPQEMEAYLPKGILKILEVGQEITI